MAMSTKVLDEIFDAYIDAEVNPSEATLKALAEAVQTTARNIRDHYVSKYQERTGNGDDPFGPIAPIIG